MTAHNNKIAVILVMFRQKQNLDNLYPSLALQNEKNMRIYFVDNNENDEDISYSKELNTKYSLDIQYLKAGYNSGFAGGNNIGAKKAMDEGFEYIFFLNSDNELTGGCIKHLIDALENDTRLGAASPLIFYGNEKKDLQLIQEFGAKSDFNKYKIIKYFTAKKYSEVHSELPDVMYCDLLSGGAVIFRKEALREAGLWEERYFAYGDEIDLFKRVKEKGYRAAAVRSARLFHNHNWSKDRKEGFYFEYYLIARNKFLYFHKFGLSGRLFMALIEECVKFPWRLIWFIKVCDLKLGLYYLKGIKDGLFNRKGKPKLSFMK